ncbi:MAG TPA: sulfotransferase family protein [Gammaproteobacteria bacterium]|nr:sulfotransferase family protein [Gammaproteobacteria bacterium]HIM04775.1 sulfotransferase family protein [Gammaproteobacteria bacterium]
MVSTTSQPSGDLKTALAHASSLLRQNPHLAEQQAREILKVHPNVEPAKRILAVAYRLQGEPDKGLAILELLAKKNADSADLLHELGLCLGATGRGKEAIKCLRQAVHLNPKHAGAWRTLGDQLSAYGDEDESRQAYEMHLQASTRHPELVDAAYHLRTGTLGISERLIRDVLKNDPGDVIAIRMLADIGIKVGQLDDAQNLLERCLELAPDFHLARHAYATLLMQRNQLEQSLSEINRLLTSEPKNPAFMIVKGAVLAQKGEHLPALQIYEKVLKNYPRHATAQMYHGHTLKTVGKLAESIDAYRKSIELSPTKIGEAYWSLANLKTFRFTDEDIANMREQFLPDTGDPDDQGHLAFALGKAFEDLEDFDQSFEYYEQGNSIRARRHRHDIKTNIMDTARQMKTLDAAFFAERKNFGCTAADPIFVIGLPRSGSTLVEQILASHSQVQGTSELPDIIAISRKLGSVSRKGPAGKYPEILPELTQERCKELGESYLDTTRVQRTNSPYFIDKMPNNFRHIGLIHLILPNAKIVDARRHPMAACFSGFKQLFASGQTFTYDLTGIGYYYRDYMKLMDHWDEVLPGRVHRVQYEDMVINTETQIQRLLEHCGLEFEEQCLRFYETERAVRTPSSEQVRQPVYTQGLEQWRNFETHLEPLKEALGPLLERYPID